MPTTNAPPQLHRNGDRSYNVLSSAVELRTLFACLGFKHIPGGPTSIFSDRWTHDSPKGRTALVYFADLRRLVLLGPTIDAVDEMAEAEEVAR